MPFYGLYIPSKNAAATTTNSNNEQNTSDSPYVFDSKNEALEVLKQHKEARLREFFNEDDAIKYAETGYEVVATPKFADPKSASTAALEKAAFRAPTKQELIYFRKVIESGDYERVKSIIWDNPRYLVSSGDTPSTLKEGYRYNALHVCAISKKPRIAELILKTVSDPKFVDLLTGKKNDEKMCKELCSNLLDYYLNIPEKGRSETPLHLAAKIGSVEMVEVLTSFPECRMIINNDGRYPKDIICSRQSHPGPDTYTKIENLLEERFYVPVLRSTDNVIAPAIGEPFQANNPPVLNLDPLSPEVKIQALAGPMSKEQAKQFRRRWKTPPRIGSNTPSPIANSPFISPRSTNKNTTPTKSFNGFDARSPHAHRLQRRALFNSSPRYSPSLEKDAQFEPQTIGNENVAADTQNGNHRNQISDNGKDSDEPIVTETNNNNNNNNDVEESDAVEGSLNNIQPISMCPSTPLMRIKKSAFFTYRVTQDINSPVVLDIPGCAESPIAKADSQNIEEHDICDSPGYKERHIKITDTEKGLELIGRELARVQNVGWREYWDFLDTFIDIASDEGLQKLENHLAQRSKDAESKKKSVKTMAAATVALDEVCSALEKFGFARDSNARDQDSNRFDMNAPTSSSSSSTITTTTTTQATATNPYTCVEKSLQVFAKRMTKTIVHNSENIICINDTLLSELKRLKSLICSFKEDVRFLEVDFSKVHSRIANLISTYLQSSQDVTIAAKAKILNILKNLENTTGERREQIECVSSRIYDKLVKHEIDQTLPENLTTEDLCIQTWLNEEICECQWDSNLSRKTSRRNRLEARYKIHQQQNAKQEKPQGELSADVVDLRSTNDNIANEANDANDSPDEDVFWSDFGGSDTESDCWYTPQDSPQGIETEETVESDSYKIYVLGNEPTKRDLDVLNAIFHTSIDVRKYPHIDAWKQALLRFPNDELDNFPSPAVIRKTHIFSSNKSTSLKQMSNEAKLTNTSPPQQPSLQQQKQQQQEEQEQMPFRKRLFSIPTRSKTFGGVNGESGSPPKTPFNKFRGLFSAYRENIENSPIPSSPAGYTKEHTSDESNNLSLLNISAAE